MRSLRPRGLSSVASDAIAAGLLLALGMSISAQAQEIGEGSERDRRRASRPVPPLATAQQGLSQAEVELLLTRAVTAAAAEHLAATIVVTDREANVLGAFAMTGAPSKTRLRGRKDFVACGSAGLDGCEVPALFAAISKAGTASFFETTGNAFTPRTAGFIIQEHFPPTVSLQAGGPLFGVQFSSLPCTDVTVPRGAASGFLPLGLSADPGGVPLYKNGEPVGGLAIEGDGVYTLDRDPLAEEPAEFPEEIAAVAAASPFEAPASIQATEILVNGIRLPFVEVGARPNIAGATGVSVTSIPGTVLVAPHAAGNSRFQAAAQGGVPGTVLVDDAGHVRFPTKASPAAGGLTAGDVDRILSQAAQSTLAIRAAIRRPIGSNARVSITVVDTDGSILGFFRTEDAPIFGVDVSAQKARTAAFFTSATAGAALRTAGLGRYADAAASDGIRLDGSVAFSNRAQGFAARPFFPDGIDTDPNGPFSKPISEWSVFNDGLQLDLISPELLRILDVFGRTGAVDNTRACTAIPAIPHGIQIFAGSVPLYKNGAFVGAVGVSGDGIDQDDFISSNGSQGFEAPLERRSDRLFVRGVRLPYVKFPRHPQL